MPAAMPPSRVVKPPVNGSQIATPRKPL